MITVDNLSKIFESKTERVAAVDGVSFTVNPGEVVTLLGPSGCGKTTTLRCIAGLERANEGRIEIDGGVVVDTSKNVFVQPHLRNLGMVFQSYAIWPHMTVFENVAYALEGKTRSRLEIKEMTMQALTLVQLDEFADRPAPRLSGGQQQRVAIARAIAGSPRALLFDEPLSNLDAKLRAEMRSELRRLQQQVGLTSVYVTHDQSEALAISDWIIVMRAGKIVEIGNPAEIYKRPKNLFTAHFIGNTNLIAGVADEVDPATHSVRVASALGSFWGQDASRDVAIGDAVRLAVRPEDLVLTKAESGDFPNLITGTISLTTFQGAATDVELINGAMQLKAHVVADEELHPGRELTFGFADGVGIVLKDEPLDELPDESP